MRHDDKTPPNGTRAFDPPLSIKPVIIAERRGKLRLKLYSALEVGKIACLIAAAHLLIRLTVAVPALVEEAKIQTGVLRSIHEDVDRAAGAKGTH